MCVISLKLKMALAEHKLINAYVCRAESQQEAATD